MRKVTVILVLLFAVAVFTGCGNGNDSDANYTQSTTQPATDETTQEQTPIPEPETETATQAPVSPVAATRAAPATTQTPAPAEPPWPAWLTFEAEQAVFPASAASITAVMTNTGPYAVGASPDYFLERYVDGQWQRVPAGIATLDVLRPIEPSGYRFSVYRRPHLDDHVVNQLNVDNFAPGRYRIFVLHVRANEIDHAQGIVTRNVVWEGPIWAEFEIA